VAAGHPQKPVGVALRGLFQAHLGAPPWVPPPRSAACECGEADMYKDLTNPTFPSTADGTPDETYAEFYKARIFAETRHHQLRLFDLMVEVYFRRRMR
jgi:hypothetical protein